MFNYARALFLIICAITLSGCATIVSGTTQKISVSSQPSGATAKVDNNLSAKTPTVFTLERKQDHVIEISTEGYKTATVMMKRTFNGMATGNILIGGLIGTGIDMASGADSKLIPERIDVRLEEGSGISEVPQFVSQKDADFYEKAIMKPAKDQKAREEEEKKKKAAAANKVPAQTNFSPINKAAVQA